jgi:hypothetical protein
MQHYTELAGQLYAPTTLTLGKVLMVPTDQKNEWGRELVWMFSAGKNPLLLLEIKSQLLS